MKKKKFAKPLNLDALNGATKRVTVGFRCDPEFKLQIGKEALASGKNLSDYMESIAYNRHKDEARKAGLAAIESGMVAIDEMQKHGNGGKVDIAMLGQLKFAVNEIVSVLKGV